MIERHYDDEALVTMLASGAETSDAHLAACGECAEKLDTFRCVTDALTDGATWDQREVSEAPNAGTIATLRAFADSMAAEDTAAEAFLAELLAQPREMWKPTLSARPEHRTAGTVRRLLAATDRALDTMPADAVELTSLAVDIASTLDPTTHRPTTLATLRGQAWRERAYALFYTGQFAEAETAVDTAERHFAGCVVDEYELARVGIVRAVVERMLERYPLGAAAAHASADTFALFGDRQRHSSATVAEAQLQMVAGNLSAAYRALTALEQSLRDTEDVANHARVLGNLGSCCLKMGRIDDSIRYHSAAADLLEGMDIHTEALRTRWSIASIIASAGRIDEARKRFESLRSEFLAIGMTSAAALVSLDIAEVLLARAQYDEVEAICRRSLDSFESSGVAHTTRARIALAYLTEATRNRTLTEAVLRDAREYINRPEHPGRLLFAQAPL